jgi:D-serine deaminase-like pyridoxal phosphate-dependent protein
MDITSPTLLLNEKTARRNIKRMVKKAADNGVDLNPHFKTHQSVIVGEWFREETLETITVSSVSMAGYFANAGWRNIVIAFPVNILEISKIAILAESVRLTLLITSTEQLDSLIRGVKQGVDILIEIDAGSHRSGLQPTDDFVISEIINRLKDTQHDFKGFYSHFGHTYRAKSSDEVAQIYDSSIKLMQDLKQRYADAQPTISIGDTPSCSIMNDFSYIKSLHAGNFVFYDLTQVQIGSCREEDIAIALACPVVSKNTARNEIIIYGGGVHLSKEYLLDRDLKTPIYGKIVKLSANGWSVSLPDCYVRSLSQEHGVVKLTSAEFNQIAIGDVIGILPAHSCMTADCMGGYFDLAGNKIDHFNGHTLS